MNKKQITIVTAVLLLIFFYGISFLTQWYQKSSEVEETTVSMESQEPAVGELQYPFELNKKYISVVDWPPVIASVDTYSCTEAGSEFERAGKTESVVIDGRQYCRSVVSEGAAGSQYTHYAYLTPSENGGALATTFSLRFVQCMNYDEPLQSECKKEQAAFTADTIVEVLFKKV